MSLFLGKSTGNEKLECSSLDLVDSCQRKLELGEFV